MFLLREILNLRDVFLFASICIPRIFTVVIRILYVSAFFEYLRRFVIGRSLLRMGDFASSYENEKGKGFLHSVSVLLLHFDLKRRDVSNCLIF